MLISHNIYLSHCNNFFFVAAIKCDEHKTDHMEKPKLDYYLYGY